tara:strand:+ start:566 stop:1081 length:516 start_codon:yes stop_codon:yes gene_type:complete
MTEKVKCFECNKYFKTLNTMHLKTHNLTLPIYLHKYPNANIIPDFNCEICGTEVTKARSPRAKYCDPCSADVKREQVLEAVKKHQSKKKKQLEMFRNKRLSEANTQYGLKYDDFNFKQPRIDNTHAAWDYIPSVMNIKGTFNESELEADRDGRVRAWKKLKYQMDKMKKKK